MQRTDFNFDTLLTEQFFAKPTKTVEEIKPDFDLPTDQDTVVNFFEKNGEQYRAGVAKLVARLEKIGKDQGILKIPKNLEEYDDSDVPDDLVSVEERAWYGLQRLIKQCDVRVGLSEVVINDKYALLTEGMENLTNILSVIESEQHWSDSRKTLIQNMMCDLSVCEPEQNKILRIVRLKLKIDLPNLFMSYRLACADKMAGIVINSHDEEFGGEMEIAHGTRPHYANSMINTYLEMLGLDKIPDGYNDTGQYIATDEMKKEFINLVSENLTASDIVDKILEENQEFLHSLKSHEVDKLISWLNNYGEDKEGVVDLIGYVDENYNYQIKPNIDYFLKHAIFRRLAKSDYFDVNELLPPFTHDRLPGVIFHLPRKSSINLAYVEPKAKDQSNIPFVLYYLDQFMEDVRRGEGNSVDLDQFCGSRLREQLQSEVKILLIRAWPYEPKEYFSELLDVFATHEHRLYLMQLLQNAGEQANKLAKGIVTLAHGDLIGYLNLDFLAEHINNADFLADLMCILNESYEFIDEDELREFLEKYEEEAEEFLTAIESEECYEDLAAFMDSGTLTQERLGKILEKKRHIKDILTTLISLFKINPGLCSKFIDAIIAQGTNVHLLKVISGLSDRDVVLTEGQMQHLFDNTTAYIAFYAAITGLTDVVKTMLADQVVTVSQLAPTDSGATLLFDAVLREQVSVIEVLLNYGAKVDEVLSIKYDLLYDKLATTKPSELAQLLLDKNNEANPQPTTEVKMTVNELGAIIGNKVISDLLKKEPNAVNSSVARSIFQAPPVEKQAESEVANQDSTNQPGSNSKL